jgi:hypothetical protein
VSFYTTRRQGTVYFNELGSLPDVYVDLHPWGAFDIETYDHHRVMLTLGGLPSDSVNLYS